MDDSLSVDISDALSERDRVRFTVHTKTKLPQFAKPVLSVVRQHEEFIWLHDCLVDNDQYAGYIIPPPPPKPDFDASREKLQRLGDCESSLTKDEFSKMKQELEAEYLAIFKKTVAMHEIFLQRLALHEKFREDGNFKIFLEYENELAVRSKSKREKLAGSIQNIGKSLTDFVITSTQVANSNSISNLASNTLGNNNTNTYNNATPNPDSRSISSYNLSNNNNTVSQYNINNNSSENDVTNNNGRSIGDGGGGGGDGSDNLSTLGSNDTDEQYFEKERLFLALYYNSIRESAICSDRVTQAHRCVAESYLDLSQQLIRLASIEVVPITAENNDPSNCGTLKSSSKLPTGGCANDHTSEGLKKLLLHVSDYLEQAKKIESRIASDEDLKLTDTLLYYKRDTVAAQELLMRRARFMSEYENATKNLEKAQAKGRTAMQYADVIQKQAKENFLSISKQAKQELIDYKRRRVVSFKRAFIDLAELEIKHLRSHSQLVVNCLNICRGLTSPPPPPPPPVATTSSTSNS